MKMPIISSQKGANCAYIQNLMTPVSTPRAKQLSVLISNISMLGIQLAILNCSQQFFFVFSATFC